MQEKLQDILQLAAQTAHQVSSGPERWESFLNTAARLYKYSFQDQLLIYAQRPDATACATYDVWNTRMNRWVRKGSTGIALISEMERGLRLKYVFDVSDTGGGKNARKPNLWSLNPDARGPVLETLKAEYSVSGDSPAACLMEAGASTVQDNYENLLPDLMKLRDNSLMEELDEEHVRLLLCSVLTASVQYVLFSRCGFNPKQYLSTDDLRGIVNFNTVATLSCLGNGTADLSSGILRQIEHTVKQFERNKAVVLEKQQEQGYNEFNDLKRDSVKEDVDHGTDIYEERRLPDSGSANERRPGGGQTREIRQDAPEIPEGEPGRDVYGADARREAVGTSSGDRPDGDGAAGAHDARADEIGGRDGEPESVGPDALGGPHERSESAGRGNNPDRTNLQLSFFPSEEEQIEQIELAEDEKSSAFLIPRADINRALQAGSGVTGGKYRINEWFQHQHSMKDSTDFLKHEYGTGGRSFMFSDGSNGSVWYDSKGFSISHEKSMTDPEFKMTWKSTAKQLRDLVLSGRYLTPEEQEGRQKAALTDEAEPEPVPLLREGQATSPDLSGQPVTRTGDTITVGSGTIFHEVVLTLSDGERDAVQQAIPDNSTLPETDALVGVSVYKVGDSVVLNFGGKELAGKIGFIGDIDIRLDETGPYSWDHQTINREYFEKALRQDRRNAPLFVPENSIPASENFHITDDHLGEGGQKTKYGYNIDAIRTLKQIEAENRTATHEEQETLSLYVGWGGIPQAFDAKNEKWADEYVELRELLTDDEYTTARASVLNAHYTSPTVIREIYVALERFGFRTGNILEPAMGVGNFFGLIPESMSKSRLYGVELDSLTGRIAKQLYPQANIAVNGFERTEFPDDFFDLGVGNVPFGEYQLVDRKYDRYKFLIHDYFFAKTLDKIRPGGLIAFLTSKGTMDKRNQEVRRYIAQRADLLGAVRLPNTAFLKNAGTEVTTDILFLQKRDRPSVDEPEWMEIGETEDSVPVNRYFLEHPQMMLGTMAFSKRMYGNAKETTCNPIEGADFGEQLKTALSFVSMPNQETLAADALLSVSSEEPEQRATLPADPAARNYSYTLVDNHLYFRENSVMNPVDLPAITLERVHGMIELRDCTRRLIDLQLDGADDEAVHAEQEKLNALYDIFIKRYGLINSAGNQRAFSEDSSYCLLCSLEILDEQGNLDRKADMFTKRTIRQKKVITSVDTASEALAASLSEKARIDLEYMSSLLGDSGSPEKIISNLQGVIYKDPQAGNDPLSGWQTADEYLSGNVRDKLEVAREAAENNPEFAGNVAALEKVQPKELTASEISIRLGANWIDPEYIDQFLYETFDTPARLQDEKGIKTRYSPITGVWNISGKGQDSFNNVQVYTTYGTSRANAYRILEETLNLRTVKIFDKKTDPDGKEHQVLNPQETTLAQQKQESIKEAFQNWIWKDPERRQALCNKYNILFNSTRPREYDGSHLTFPGMNPEIRLRTHQLNAVARGLYGKNTLLAHCVGAGKTYEMIAIAMKSKQIGLCQKSLIDVPNHLTEQWGGDFLRLYPGANILVSTKRDFEPQNRKKFCARITTGNYDAVIIGHSQFEKIPVSKERQIMMVQEQIDDIEWGIDQAKQEKGESFTIKQMEKNRKNLLARLERLNDGNRKDDVVTFEELGVDRLFVDEADSFKNLFLYTKMRNVAGIGQTEAQKSSDMFAKCRYMDELTDGRGITFATGTPISNSMTELYTMMRYLQYSMLQEKNLLFFDNWAATFGETVTATELAPEGTGFRTKTRFARFFNLPELMSMWKEAADIQTADMLNLPVPEAKYINIITQPTQIQKDAVQALGDRAEDVRHRSVDPSVDNMLRITNDGRMLALDQRLMNLLLPDDPDSKVNACVKNILEVWQETASTKGAQLVFCDLSTPKKTIQMEMVNDVAEMVKGQFTDVYNDICQKLILQGVPEEEIEFIHNAKTEVQKAELFAKVRNGQVRVLLGSTAKMGAGTNVQDRLAAEHHIDCPWKPRDIEQREGRILRQGNRYPNVRIFRYVTEGTFDAYSWQLIENKQKFISQIMTGRSPVRSCEDIDESVLSYAEVKALATGDPRIKEKMDLDIQVAKLKMLKAGFLSQHYTLEDKLLKFYPEVIQRKKVLIDGLTDDLKFIDTHPAPSAENFSMTIKGMAFNDKKEAGMALIRECGKLNYTNDKASVGEYCSFSVQLQYDQLANKFYAVLLRQASHRTELSQDPIGNITRLNNDLKVIPQRLETERKNLEILNRQVKESEEEIKKAFPKEQELAEKTERLDQLTLELSVDHSQENSNADIPSNSLSDRIRNAHQSSPDPDMEQRTRPLEK